ncbi:hypothetical protein ncot_15985 [Nocardioides sp. JQ2195]|uniref:DUF6318 family protein n=1 Tax=Nocardioides sp. JQ2195 TaxID=2592334 RepID=UPI00143E2B89|nr:DUF6318 family protein [Nocardioides sp. JQ2195]QIX27920.1 hypothetical protein ncot_15985 [Nocardioides sp. JQ2195]
MHRRAGVVLVCALLIGGLGSCSDDPPPQGLPIDAKVDVPEVGGPPDIPKKLSLTESGAKFFVGYWVDAYNWGLESGSTKLVRGLSSPDCAPCQTLFAAVEDAHRDKAQVKTLGVDTVPMEVGIDKRARTARVKFFVMRYPVKIRRGKDDVQEIRGGTSPIRFDLVRHGKTWRVRNLELVPVRKQSED